jgi:nitrate/nitrite transport system ATP-binding protein
MPLLEIVHASKGYGPKWNRTEVLEDLNLTVEKGEFVAIVGFSGSGKTTLMNLLSGLALPDTGQVLAHGQPVTGPSSERALVFQNYSLLPWLTVYENIALAVDQLFGDWDRATRRAHTERYIEMVKLTAARDKRPAELSGGMRQRVAVARALAMKPSALLCDEPLSALDALTRATLQDELSRIRREDAVTVVLITNDPDEALLLADRVIPLTAGPRATLGPSMPVALAHPRDRKTIAEEPEFIRLRQELVDYLLRSKKRHHAVVERKLVLPDILPEDLSGPRRTRPWFGGRGPVRRAEIKSVEVETK